MRSKKHCIDFADWFGIDMNFRATDFRVETLPPGELACWWMIFHCAPMNWSAFLGCRNDFSRLMIQKSRLTRRWSVVAIAVSNSWWGDCATRSQSSMFGYTMGSLLLEGCCHHVHAFGKDPWSNQEPEWEYFIVIMVVSFCETEVVVMAGAWWSIENRHHGDWGMLTRCLWEAREEHSAEWPCGT